VFSGAQPYRSSVQVVTAPSLCFSFDVRSLLGISIMVIIRRQFIHPKSP
jgi:hypothetical protein